MQCIISGFTTLQHITSWLVPSRHNAATHAVNDPVHHMHHSVQHPVSYQLTDRTMHDVVGPARRSPISPCYDGLYSDHPRCRLGNCMAWTDETRDPRVNRWILAGVLHTATPDTQQCFVGCLIFTMLHCMQRGLGNREAVRLSNEWTVTKWMNVLPTYIHHTKRFMHLVYNICS